jgi:hypothetical protein
MLKIGKTVFRLRTLLICIALAFGVTNTPCALGNDNGNPAETQPGNASPITYKKLSLKAAPPAGDRFSSLRFGRNDAVTIGINLQTLTLSRVLPETANFVSQRIENLTLGMKLKQAANIFEGADSSFEGNGTIDMVGNTVLVKQYMVGPSQENPGAVLLYFHEGRLFCIQVRLLPSGNREERSRLIEQLVSYYGGVKHESHGEYYDTEYANSIELMAPASNGIHIFTRGQWFYIRDEATATNIGHKLVNLGLEEMTDVP